MCAFPQFSTSHYLIGHFQVGFMSAKLISVSKFSNRGRDREENVEKKKNTGELVLPVSFVMVDSTIV